MAAAATATRLPFDLGIAIQVGSLVTGSQPPTSPQERASIGSAIRDAVSIADASVRAFTGWTSAPPTPVPEVLARRDWVRGNLEAIDGLLDRVPVRAPSMPAIARRAAGVAIGVQVGAIFGYLSQKVVGQYNLLGGERLLFVGPNLVAIERSSGVSPRSFRLWVALHEVTHRLQFAAVPWLRERLDQFIERSFSTLGSTLPEVTGRLRQVVGQGRTSFASVLLSPEQRALLADAQTLMTVVEGQASFVMNELGRELIPDVEELRAAIEGARTATGSGERTFQRAIGLAQKHAQYADGERFFRAICDEAGTGAMLAVFADQTHLPDAAELKDPALWLARVAP